MTDDWFREYGAERKPLVRTGMPGLDFSFGGFAQHQLGVIVANSNVGKTTFAINMAINMAREGKRVLFFSLEMPAFEIIDKCISITGNHNAFEIFNRSKRSELLLETVFQFQDYPITIISRGSITSQDVIAEAYSRVMNNEVDVVFVDYLQLLTDRFGDNEQQRLTRIAQNLKNFCLTYNVPIITPAQVDKESSKSGAIRLENIAGAKSIGDSADVSFYLYEKENKTSMTEDGETEIRLKIVKSRTSTKYQDMLVNFDRQTLKMTIE
jgi:replicative DNA helicase